MGKYFDGKRFNYIKTGATELSRDAVNRISKAEKRAKNKRKLDKRVKKSKKSILGGNLDIRRSISSALNILVLRYRKITDRHSSTAKVKKKKTTRKKKASKWENLVNGVKVRFTQRFIAIRNRAKQLYEFLDEI